MTATVPVTDAETTILAWTDLVSHCATDGAAKFAMWVINDGPGEISVTFEPSPCRGGYSDVDQGEAVTVPVGRSATQVRVDELRRWWRIIGQAAEGTTASVRVGVTVSR